MRWALLILFFLLFRRDWRSRYALLRLSLGVLGKAQQESRTIVSAGLATVHPPDAPLNAFPARNLGYISNDKAVARHILLHQRVFWSKLPHSLIQQKPLKRVALPLLLYRSWFRRRERVLRCYSNTQSIVAVLQLCTHTILTYNLFVGVTIGATNLRISFQFVNNKVLIQCWFSGKITSILQSKKIVLLYSNSKKCLQNRAICEKVITFVITYYAESVSLFSQMECRKF